MPIEKQELNKILRDNFPEATIEIVDLAGDNDHYSVKITDKIFIGKTKIEQHRIVNNALKEVLKDTLHAMQLNTFIPKL